MQIDLCSFHQSMICLTACLLLILRLIHVRHKIKCSPLTFEVKQFYANRIFIMKHHLWSWSMYQIWRKNNFYKQHWRQFLIYRLSTYICSIRSSLDKASGLSILFPSTSNGIPFSEGLLNKSWSSLLDTGKLS